MHFLFKTSQLYKQFVQFRVILAQKSTFDYFNIQIFNKVWPWKTNIGKKIFAFWNSYRIPTFIFWYLFVWTRSKFNNLLVTTLLYCEMFCIFFTVSCNLSTKPIVSITVLVSLIPLLKVVTYLSPFIHQITYFKVIFFHKLFSNNQKSHYFYQTISYLVFCLIVTLSNCFQIVVLSRGTICVYLLKLLRKHNKKPYPFSFFLNNWAYQILRPKYDPPKLELFPFFVGFLMIGLFKGTTTNNQKTVFQKLLFMW